MSPQKAALTFQWLCYYAKRVEAIVARKEGYYAWAFRLRSSGAELAKIYGYLYYASKGGKQSTSYGGIQRNRLELLAIKLLWLVHYKSFFVIFTEQIFTLV